MSQVGIDPAKVRAVDQAQRAKPVGVGAPGWPAQKFQPLPTPNGAAPFRATSADLELPAASGPRVFHVIGDTGGIGNPTGQNAVVAAMVADVAAHPEVGFAWHVGDIGYFNGEVIAFTTQFFEAYASYPREIIGNPGNHDNDPLPGSAPLAEYMAVFCSPSRVLLSGTEEYGRKTQTQPNCYFTLLDPAVTIIALATNVPSGGVVEAHQAAWFEGELAAAPADVPLIVSLHHPPISVDAHHGGSATMGALLDAAFEKANRWPELVLSGHVHDVQIFTRTWPSGKQTVYGVSGCGGYPNLHALAADATPGMQVTADTVFDYGDASEYGFLRLSVEGKTITGTVIGVAKDGTVTPDKYSFTA